MNIFSNIGITELIVILLLALLVVGPERLPEMGRKLAKTLRDVRKAYENLTKDLGPELMSIQQATQELRDSVQSVKSIPQDAVKSVVDAADLDDTIAELKEVTGDLEGVRKTVAGAGKVVRDPVGAAVSTAKSTLQPPKPTDDSPSGQEIRDAEAPTLQERERTTQEEGAGLEAAGALPAAGEDNGEQAPTGETDTPADGGVAGGQEDGSDE
jgi:sec-independent protein translocase protein TatB